MDTCHESNALALGTCGATWDARTEVVHSRLDLGDVIVQSRFDQKDGLGWEHLGEPRSHAASCRTCADDDEVVGIVIPAHFDFGRLLS